MRFFSEIAQIPHGSGNTQKLEKYCLDFAAARNLHSFQDDYGNVMLFKDGTPGYENSAPVILQGHLDMVCEKKPDCPADMEKDPIKIQTDGEHIWADGTTLGADDGIAIAYILALLDSDTAKHPPIEALFTCDEEVGLRGARMLDASHLKGQHLINIDSEEEGILTVGCAGAVRAFCENPLSSKKSSGRAGIVKISGLQSGHSGVDIDKNRQNAIQALAWLLDSLREATDIQVADIQGGGRLNVIPQTAQAVICADDSRWSQVCEAVQALSEQMQKEWAATEPDASITLEETALPANCLDESGTRDLIFTLLQAPTGVFAMNPHIPGLVQTSLNLASVQLEGGMLKTSFMIRSNTDFGKRLLVRQLTALMEHLDGHVRLEDDYPAWEYCQESLLRDRMVQAYQDIYGQEPAVCTIHAGLECGILSEKLPGVDMVSFGPDLENVHTPAERMGVKSAERCWNYLLHVLELLK